MLTDGLWMVSAAACSAQAALEFAAWAQTSPAQRAEALRMQVRVAGMAAAYWHPERKGVTAACMQKQPASMHCSAQLCLCCISLRVIMPSM